jgi:GTP-sensing pleiotropic transcriptional regulator CodY
MKVLIDTNIWIDFVNGQDYGLSIQKMIADELVLKHLWIEGELRSGYIPNRLDFIETYSNLETSKLINYEILFVFIEKEKLFGKGLNLIDLGIYVSARMGGHLIWTRDKNLKKLCDSKNILYKESK